MRNAMAIDWLVVQFYLAQHHYAIATLLQYEKNYFPLKEEHYYIPATLE